MGAKVAAWRRKEDSRHPNSPFKSSPGWRKFFEGCCSGRGRRRRSERVRALSVLAAWRQRKVEVWKEGVSGVPEDLLTELRLRQSFWGWEKMCVWKGGNSGLDVHYGDGERKREFHMWKGRRQGCHLSDLPDRKLKNCPNEKWGLWSKGRKIT